ncbi:MAG: aminotransferase class V-fold PLP-dependent enzyme [Chloroflexi bacterium]|nr:MAG: aminotransferase class V-fold PLP-dependent enzyme [Chloroflexota bacterium]MBL1193011.1 aminotransferase class V-fold PLP-dependent enzyme [Chloroflexota bacterium]NOH10304.1 aminotransferase class V-fold PLP-dependent enzyme [Chloroflexota bacterium]
MKIETLAIHAAHTPDPSTGDISPPIHLSTTFERGPDGDYPGGHQYTRGSNPNRSMLEAALAQLAGGEVALAFASGLAAIHSVFAALQPGDHVVASADIYHGTIALLREIMQPWGLEIDFVDLDDKDSLANAIKSNAQLVYIETPSNPLLKITDITAVVEISRAANAKVVVDNTWATPVLQRPLDMGADITVHSSTKYFGGHSDVMGGAVIVRQADEFFERIRNAQYLAGGVPAAFDSWLIRRGISTLPLRIRAQSATASQIANFLAQHPQVEKVHYPGLESHPRHVIAKEQMQAFGAMLSFEVADGEAAARKVPNHTKLFQQATSLGGVESLIEHRASMEGPHSSTPRNLLRLSVGLEHGDDLIADLERVLEK